MKVFFVGATIGVVLVFSMTLPFSENNLRKIEAENQEACDVALSDRELVLFDSPKGRKWIRSLSEKSREEMTAEDQDWAAWYWVKWTKKPLPVTCAAVQEVEPDQEEAVTSGQNAAFELATSLTFSCGSGSVILDYGGPALDVKIEGDCSMTDAAKAFFEAAKDAGWADCGERCPECRAELRDALLRAHSVRFLAEGYIRIMAGTLKEIATTQKTKDVVDQTLAHQLESLKKAFRGEE